MSLGLGTPATACRPACLPAPPPHQHNPLAPGPLLLSLLPQDTSRNDPRKRLRRFFESLYACLAKGARAVLQVYPANTDQAAMMTNAAMRAGFGGGLVVDFPHRCLLLSACCFLPAACCLLLSACCLLLAPFVLPSPACIGVAASGVAVLLADCTGVQL